MILHSCRMQQTWQHTLTLQWRDQCKLIGYVEVSLGSVSRSCLSLGAPLMCNGAPPFNVAGWQTASDGLLHMAIHLKVL